MSEASSKSHGAPQSHRETQSYPSVHPSTAGKDPDGDGDECEDESEQWACKELVFQTQRSVVPDAVYCIFTLLATVGRQ